MLEIKNKDDKLRLLSELEKNYSDFNSYMWGIDNDIEKSILKFISQCGGIATLPELLNNLVFHSNICTRNRLINRVESLVTHEYLYKVSKKITYGIYQKEVICYVLRLD